MATFRRSSSRRGSMDGRAERSARLNSIRIGEAAEFELLRLETAGLQHPHALFERIANRLDAAQRQRLRRVDFERDVLAGESDALVETQLIGITSNCAIGMLGGGHVLPHCSKSYGVRSQ